jgi:hypothetical protein
MKPENQGPGNQEHRKTRNPENGRRRGAEEAARGMSPFGHSDKESKENGRLAAQ